jgi:O-6-methylguanine DNA methyltransferase
MDGPGVELGLYSTEAALVAIAFGEELDGWRRRHFPGATLVPAASRHGDFERQLRDYFEGRRRVFDLPLELVGSDFQKDVWRAVARVPYGRTASYGQIAHLVGRPKASRAVGAANGANPLPIVIPCHRIVGRDGGLTGYGGGLPLKRRLLALEGALHAPSVQIRLF